MDKQDEERKKSKRVARTKARSRISYIEDDLDTDYSHGSLETSTDSPDLQAESFDSGQVQVPLTSMQVEQAGVAEPVQEIDHRCSFCWRGKKSSLGQGFLVRCVPTPGFNPFKRQLKVRQGSTDQDLKKRVRGDSSRSPIRPQETGKYAGVYNELADVGLPDDISISHVFSEPDRAVWAHHCCAAWCNCVLQAEDYSLQYVDKAAFNGLNMKCNFCGNAGATIQCKAPRCTKKFHYPCASGSGCFQDIKTLTLLCPEHAHLAVSISGGESHCVVCNEAGDILKQLFCTSCGQHYHGSCLEPEIECNTVVRAGWQCPECKVCQECRKPGDDNKMLVCDVCDKGFHTFCLVPQMKTLPPPGCGWRCQNCRSCTDCGSKTAGNSPSAKWRVNYSVCDICYQHRNKGLVCPICKRAYKMNNLKGLIMCSSCKKYVHSACDLTISDSTDVEKYRCTVCAVVDQALSEAAESPPCAATMSPHAVHEDLLQLCDPAASLQNDSELESELGADSELLSLSSTSSKVKPTRPGKGKPPSYGKLSRTPGKKVENRSKGQVMKRKSRTATERRKNQSKSKQLISTSHNSAPNADSISKSEEDHHSTVVLAASSDEFVLTQDMCMSCGSFGLGTEGHLIVCSQCSQCYHPSCAQVKLNRVVLTKGWRCLDCTVCEGCGKPTDEGLLLLCDECDISYHTYCLDPPLKYVPKGNWKCKWCVHCRYCGSTDPGWGCEWLCNYTECGPCRSVTDCPVCDQCYMDSELVIQCTQCERWLHAACDNMQSEEEAERMSDLGYQCLYCRPKTGAPSPRPLSPEEPPPIAVLSPPLVPVVKEEAKTYMVDGVCLSEHGMSWARELIIEAAPGPLTSGAASGAFPNLVAAGSTVKPKNRQQRIKQSHPQMAHLLSTTDSVADEESSFFAEDARPTDLDCDPLLSAGDGMVQSDDIAAAADGSGASDVVLSCENVGGDPSEVAKKRRTRKPMPLGIGGFVVKPRIRAPNKLVVQGPSDASGQPPILLLADFHTEGGPAVGEQAPSETPSTTGTGCEKAKRKRKPRKKGILEDAYPVYMQEAFFGKGLLHESKLVRPDEHIVSPDNVTVNEQPASLKDRIPDSCTIQLAEGTVVPSMLPSSPHITQSDGVTVQKAAAVEVQCAQGARGSASSQVDDVHGIDDFKDILPGDILPGGLHEELFKILALEEHQDTDIRPTNESSDTKLQSCERISIHTTDDPDGYIDKNLDAIDIDPSKLEDFLKGMLATEVPPTTSADMSIDPEGALLGVESSPASSGCNVRYSMPPPPSQYSQVPSMAYHTSLRVGVDTQAVPPPAPPGAFNPSSYSESPVPAWAGADHDDDSNISFNKRNMLKWKDDEPLGLDSTISPILFANTSHPELKQQYPEWSERCKHISKLWRKLTTEQRSPFLVKARENRTKRSKEARLASTEARRKAKVKESPLQSPRGSHGNISPAGGSVMSSEDIHASGITVEDGVGTDGRHSYTSVTHTGESDAFVATPGTSASSVSHSDLYSQQPSTPVSKVTCAPLDTYCRGVSGSAPPPHAGYTTNSDQPPFSMPTPVEPFGLPPSTAMGDVYLHHARSSFSADSSMLTGRASMFPSASTTHGPLPVFPSSGESNSSESAGLTMNTDEMSKQQPLRDMLTGKSRPPVTDHPVAWQHQEQPRRELLPGKSQPPGPDHLSTWQHHEPNRFSPIPGIQSQQPDFPHSSLGVGYPVAQRPWSSGESHSRPISPFMGVRPEWVRPSYPMLPFNLMRPSRGRYPAGVESMDPRSLADLQRLRMNVPAGAAGVPRMFGDGLRMASGVPPRPPSMSYGDSNPYSVRAPSDLERSLPRPERMSNQVNQSRKSSDSSDPEALEDLLGTDGNFNLLAFTDPELDITLAEHHDKNMFDEHLGLKKDSAEVIAGTQSSAKFTPDTTAVAEIARGNDSTVIKAVPERREAKPTVTTKPSPHSSQHNSPKACSTASSPHTTVTASSPHPTAASSSPHPVGTSASPQQMGMSGSPHPASASPYPIGASGSPHAINSTSAHAAIPGGTTHHGHMSVTSQAARAPSSPHHGQMAGVPYQGLKPSGSPHPVIMSGKGHAGAINEQRPPSRLSSHEHSLPASIAMETSSSSSIPGYHPAFDTHNTARSHLQRQLSHDRGVSPMDMSSAQVLPGHYINVYGPRSPAFALSPSLQHPNRPADHMGHMGHMPYGRQESAPANPLQELLDEEKRLQRTKQHEMQSRKPVDRVSSDHEMSEKKVDRTLLSDAEFEKLKADVVSEGPTSNDVPAASPHSSVEGWQQMSGGVVPHGSEFHPPPPPPYPGTGRITPSHMLRLPYSHLPHPMSSGILQPPSPGPQSFTAQHLAPALNEMKPEDVQQRDILHAKEMELGASLKRIEKELAAHKKARKQLMNRQKQLKKNGEDLSISDAQQLEKLTVDCAASAKELEQTKKDHKQNQLLLQEFSMKQQDRMLPWGQLGHPQRGMTPSYLHVAPLGSMHRMRGMFPSHPRMMDPRMMDPRMMDPRMMDPRLMDPRMIERRVIDTRTMDPHQKMEFEMMQMQRIPLMHRSGGLHPAITRGLYPGVFADESKPFAESSATGNPLMRCELRYNPTSSNSIVAADFSDEERSRVAKQQQRLPHASARGTPPDNAAFPKQSDEPQASGGDAYNARAHHQNSNQHATLSQTPATQTAEVPKQGQPPEFPKKKRQRRRRVLPMDEKPVVSSLHMGHVPLSFPGQHLHPAPKPLLATVPFNFGYELGKMTEIADMPAEVMASFGNQYPLELIKSEVQDPAHKTEISIVSKTTSNVLVNAAADSETSTKHNRATLDYSTSSKQEATTPSLLETATVQVTDKPQESAVGNIPVIRGVASVGPDNHTCAPVASAEKAAQVHCPKEPTTMNLQRDEIVSCRNVPSDPVCPDANVSAAASDSGDLCRARTCSDSPVAGSTGTSVCAPAKSPSEDTHCEQNSASQPITMAAASSVHMASQSDKRLDVESHLEQSLAEGGKVLWTPDLGIPPEMWEPERMRIAEKRSVMLKSVAECTSPPVGLTRPSVIQTGISRPHGSIQPLSNQQCSSVSVPLHAMQNMQPVELCSIVGTPVEFPTNASNTPLDPCATSAKKKRSQAPANKRKQKPPALPRPAPTLPSPSASPASPVQVPLPAGSAPSSFSEPAKILESITQNLRSLSLLNLQEPLLQPLSYTLPLQPLKVPRHPPPRAPIRPPVAPKLIGAYGQACIEGKYDVYCYAPYTNTTPPHNKPSHAGEMTALPARKPCVAAATSKQAKSTEPSTADVYDLSRFQKVISRTQPPDLQLPQAPRIQPRSCDRIRVSASPSSLVGASSPELDSVTDEAVYPYLKPIKMELEKEVAVLCSRTSPDIFLHAPVPVRGLHYNRGNVVDTTHPEATPTDLSAGRKISLPVEPLLHKAHVLPGEFGRSFIKSPVAEVIRQPDPRGNASIEADPTQHKTSSVSQDLLQKKHHSMQDEALSSVGGLMPADLSQHRTPFTPNHLQPLKGQQSSAMDTDLGPRADSAPMIHGPSHRDHCDINPFASLPEDELKSAAVGIQSSLQSAIRASPSNQVSVTLTLSSEAAQNIPNVLSALADLLRMAAPPTSYHISRTSPDKELLSMHDHAKYFCRHCDVHIPVHSMLLQHRSEFPFRVQEEKDGSEMGEYVHFCSKQCMYQFTLSHQASPPIDLSQKDVGGVIVEHKAEELASPIGSGKSVRNTSKKAKRRVSADCSGKQCKKWKGKRWRRWDIKVTFNLHQYEEPTEEDIFSTLMKVGQIVRPNPLPKDSRTCILCHQTGDLDPKVCSRLLNYDADIWVHLNCALWSMEVYETLNGALMNVELSVKRGAQAHCVICSLTGATIGCFKPRCPNLYHVACAHKMGCMFFQDKTMLCPVHMPKESPEQLRSLHAARKVYVNRDESQQIANAVHSDDQQYTVRIGAVVYFSIGQLFTHQISTGRFHNRDYIYPVGYRCVRYFWSMRHANKRCAYECAIEEDEGAPEFVITVKEKPYADLIYKDKSLKGAWNNILHVVEKQRKEGDYVKIFPQYLSGEYLFGLKEPAIIRIIESLPGTELLAGYAFKFGRAQLFEMPPAINPTGCARSEPKLRTHFRKPHTLQTSSRSQVLPAITVSMAGDVNSPYHKQFVHSKSQQYRRLKTEWRNHVYLGRSRIQGLGMFAARDIEKHTMVIEYIGEIIRNELAEFREKIYENHNRGVYMFRITPDFVIDATMTGGPARYINHSCNPNCVAETVAMGDDVKIIIIANRRIAKGEELNYDYKFDLEDDSSKIPCNCGAANCRKWMN